MDGETELALKEGARFSNFEEVEKALGELKEKYHHPFRAFNSLSVKEANLRRLKAFKLDKRSRDFGFVANVTSSWWYSVCILLYCM